ncbi:hypothetical protein SAMN02745146_2888 [Hymenobacter daecheongensis DSM 21074]|uniref:Uncharacterized protein n=1 Tax=Hymenobacter daecheongensis DSM 21074 TaxID=1121955 RepID=A0A1M6ILQ5_9BACT|nr:hypothetical protein [Hymenobacter daecheongensis]SHJ35327.1 hypothetical protein SAMN02745146_2888 [Hymenobacter daecheongensis DSM 21074]
MRHRLLLLLPAPLLLSLLVACSKTPAGPRLDLVGSSRYTSFDRILTTPGDTVTFKLYSSVRTADRLLTHVRIFVNYTPTKNPLRERADYDAVTVAANQDPELVFLDSAMSAREFLLQTTLNARTTSGREKWRFEAEDAEGNKVSRSFQLQLRNSDSLRLTYHRYTAQLQAPGAGGNRRSFLALLPGLTLPRFTVRTNAAAQSLIDVVYVATRNGIVLAAPTDTIAHLAAWPARPTAFRSTALDKAGFDAADTGQELTDLFAGNPNAPATRTAPLAKGQVYAFRTQDQKSGLFFVQEILTAPVPTVLLQVRVTK